MKYILATKEKMTQFFDEDGNALAATLLSAGPVVVTQVKGEEKDGYRAIQVGYGAKRKISKPLQGHFKKRGNFRYVREYRLYQKENDQTSEAKEGDVFDVSQFEKGDRVIVSGINKGKGFQGVVKRHGFKGGRRSHGQKHSEREPGSIGATAPQRVFKGIRMAGRMGGKRTTVKNLKVLGFDKGKNTLLVSGAVPGRRGTLVEISEA